MTRASSRDYAKSLYLSALDSLEALEIEYSKEQFSILGCKSDGQLNFCLEEDQRTGELTVLHRTGLMSVYFIEESYLKSSAYTPRLVSHTDATNLVLLYSIIMN